MLGTILIVEDSDVARKAIHLWLETTFPQAQIFEASSGEEAVAIAGARQFDAILMDINLPQMSGIEATRRIKYSGQPARVAMLTIHDEKAYHNAAMEAGASGFVSKHEMDATLLPILREWLSGEQENDDAI